MVYEPGSTPTYHYGSLEDGRDGEHTHGAPAAWRLSVPVVPVSNSVRGKRKRNARRLAWIRSASSRYVALRGAHAVSGRRELGNAKV